MGGFFLVGGHTDTPVFTTVTATAQSLQLTVAHQYAGL